MESPETKLHLHRAYSSNREMKLSIHKMYTYKTATSGCNSATLFPMVYPVRLYKDDQSIEKLTERLLARTLPKSEWTHEAHFAATTCLILKYPQFDLKSKLPRIIASYNIAIGGENTDFAGYHETLTQFNLALISQFVKNSRHPTLTETVNALLLNEIAKRDHPLQYYAKDVLYSKEARLAWREPHLKPWPPISNSGI